MYRLGDFWSASSAVSKVSLLHDRQASKAEASERCTSMTDSGIEARFAHLAPRRITSIAIFIAMEGAWPLLCTACNCPRSHFAGFVLTPQCTDATRHCSGGGSLHRAPGPAAVRHLPRLRPDRLLHGPAQRVQGVADPAREVRHALRLQRECMDCGVFDCTANADCAFDSPLRSEPCPQASACTLHSRCVLICRE